MWPVLAGGGGDGTSERGLMGRRRDTVSPFFDGSPNGKKIWDAYKRAVLLHRTQEEGTKTPDALCLWFSFLIVDAE